MPALYNVELLFPGLSLPTAVVLVQVTREFHAVLAAEIQQSHWKFVEKDVCRIDASQTIGIL